MEIDPKAKLTDLAPVVGPLNGVVVLELDGVEPSKSFGAQILADLGATVVLIERPPVQVWKPWELDSEFPLSADEAFGFGLNRNKLSISLNLKSDEGRSIFHQLVEHADVVYDNYRIGVSERLGTDHETLAALNPEIITCSVTGFGATSPRARQPAYDVVIQALGGGMSLTGESDDGPPVRFGNPIGGLGGALYAVIGILSALRERRVSHQAAHLDISLLDAQLAMISYRVPQVLDLGMEFGPQSRRGGNGALPYGPFLTSDGRWFALAITSQFWRGFCAAVGRPEWLDDPRFESQDARQQHEDELNREVETEIATKTADEWQAIFLKAQIPGAVVRSVREAYGHPHVALRDMLVGFQPPIPPEVKVSGDPIKSSTRAQHEFKGAPRPGEHTRLVLSDVLGFDERRIDELLALELADSAEEA